MYRIIGVILIIDALLSFTLVEDRRFLWQLGRIVRFILGLALILFVENGKI